MGIFPHSWYNTNVTDKRAFVFCLHRATSRERPFVRDRKNGKRRMWLYVFGEENMDYQEYLKSEKWQFTRQIILNFWGQRCALCNSQKNIEVHHRTYERLGHELTTDLLPLCQHCHTHHHNFVGNFFSEGIKT